ncbi:hypothetical protein C1H46_044934 [Malus baccata]|uniref:Uncharacterized protein n=1 Tax=Malus baccata TaxID=106549 RepID=A0A540K5Q3_MALBA|nr:hypothetical protein C1H46_044934 [Malus baccata]
MSKRAFGLEEWRPEGKRRRVSQRVGDSMRNQARGGDIVGPHPGRRCLPYGAWRNRREMKVGAAMR